jgi:putative DNA primase/helicase
MRFFGSLFGNDRKTPNGTGEARRQHSLRGARSTPAGKPSTLPALSFATPALSIPEDGGGVLDELAAASRRAVFMTEDDAATCALFAVHAHCLDVAQTSPLLAISAPTHGCGKTTLLRVMAALVPSPLFVSDVTPAALYRRITNDTRTLLVDEAETLLLGNGRLQRLLNAGHCRDAATVARADGIFNLWCAKIIALTGELPATLHHRALRIYLKRKRASDHVIPLDAVGLASMHKLSERGARWAAQNHDRLIAANPVLPEGLINRVADNWQPLLAIADAVGGHWPETARKLAQKAAETDIDDKSAIALLRDIRDYVLDLDRTTDRVSTEQLLFTLQITAERPWARYNRGGPITSYQLAQLLKPFGISPRVLRFGDELARGYLIADFRDAFERYVLVRQEKASAVWI